MCGQRFALKLIVLVEYLQIFGQLHKLTKILFARDGPYMVMMPYHTANKGILFRVTRAVLADLG